MDEISTLPEGEIVKEETLRAGAKDLRTSFHSLLKSHQNHGDILKLLDSYFKVLFATALSSAITLSHRTACCNLICGTIDQCLSAQDGDIVAFGCSTTIFQHLENVYFDCYENAKEKSMKQVLSTHAKVLAKASLLASSNNQTVLALRNIFVILFQNHQRDKAKPAFHALQLYLLKDIIKPSSLVEEYYRWELDQRLVAGDDGNLDALQRFLLALFDWTAAADVAPSVGQVVTSFLRRLHADEINPTTDLQLSNDTPVWAEPLFQSFSGQMHDVTTFRSYILPGLFQKGVAEFWAFLRYLNVESHLNLVNFTGHGKATISETNSYAAERILLFNSMLIGKELGFLLEIDCRISPEIIITDDAVHIPDVILGRLLSHGTIYVRLSGLALLLASKRTTTPYTHKTLQVIAINLPNFYADPDPEIRSEVQSFVQVLINRLRVIMAGLSRAQIKASERKSQHPTPTESRTNQSHGGKEMKALLLVYNYHKRFLIWFKKFLQSELHPAASYQRHISALKTLQAVLRSGLDESVEDCNLSRQAKIDVPWPLHLTFIDKPMLRVLLDLLLDPFEDVRQTTLELLNLVKLDNPNKSNFDAFEEVRIALRRAQLLMARSGRADHADGLARLYSLYATRPVESHDEIFSDTHLESPHGSRFTVPIMEEIMSSIEESLAIARTHFTMAVSKHTIHGYFTSLRYVLEAVLKQNSQKFLPADYLSSTIDRILQLISGTWDCVKPLLCNDAPEGFMPEDLQNETVSTKDISSFAWRALKESGLLLQSLNVKEIQVTESTSAEVLAKRLARAGDLCFAQLADLRHRGALSTVTQVFTFICRQCATNGGTRTQSLLNGWYKETLDLIEAKGAVTTRRSAGIPALLVAILCAGSESPTFDQVISDLTVLASRVSNSLNVEESELPQVHALNSLKAVFSTPALVEPSDLYIVKVMQIASSSLSSPAWSIRNCGLMLFRSLIDRLLGSNESFDEASVAKVFSGSRLSYHRYPGLLDLIIRLLSNTQRSQSAGNGSDMKEHSKGLVESTEASFPVLDLLRRAPPPASFSSQIRHLILQACQSNHWHIRDLAARTFTASVRPNEVTQIASELLIQSCSDQNSRHGRFLILKYMSRAVCSSHNQLLGENGYAISFSFASLLLSEVKSTLTSASAGQVKATYLSACNSVLESRLYIANNRINGDSSDITTNLLAFIIDFLTERTSIDALLLREALLFRLILSFLQDLKLDREIGTQRQFELALSDLLNHEEAAVFVFQWFKTRLAGFTFDAQALFANEVSRVLSNCKRSETVQAGEQCMLKIIERWHLSNPDDLHTSIEYFTHIDAMARMLTHAAPLNMETNIRIWPLSLAIESRNTALKSDVKLVGAIRQWLGCVEAMLDSSHEHSLRHSAIRSMHAFVSNSSVDMTTQPELFTIMAFAVYDALNDDDEQLRELASEVCQALLLRTWKTRYDTGYLVPLVASSQLCELIRAVDSGSQTLFWKAMSRLLQQDCGPFNDLRTVDCILSDTSRNDDVLFVVEKQNLYIDEVREAFVWSEMLKQLPVEQTPQKLINSLTDWVINGLDCLIDKIKGDFDGPLGWASKPDVFISGIRVIRGADVLLTWRNNTKRVKVKASTILIKLEYLRNCGAANGLHELWMSTLEGVLKRNVKRRLTSLVASLKKLPVDFI